MKKSAWVHHRCCPRTSRVHTDATAQACGGFITHVFGFVTNRAWHHPELIAGTVTLPQQIYHLYCSNNGNHDGFGHGEGESMIFYHAKLPEKLKAVVSRTDA